MVALEVAMKLTKRTLRGGFPPMFVGVMFVCPIVSWMAAFLRSISFKATDFALTKTALVNSHWLAFITAVSCLVLSFPLALSEPFLPPRLRPLLWSIIFGPVCVGMLPRNFAWQGMLSGRELTSSMGWSIGGLGPRILYTDYAVVLVMAFVFLPFAFFVLSLGTAIIRPIHIEAARVAGASSGQIARRIFLPVLAESAVIAFFLIYCSSLGYFITPAMIGSNAKTFAGTLITKLINLSDFSFGSIAGLLLLLSSMPSVVGFLWLATRRRSVLSWKG
jgi:ABC-type spermidine/putrescine transport system permease subunit I